MDLWRWITDYARQLADDGDMRLARMLMRLPEATCDDRHAEVDAMMPELLATVRARKHPWLEVYARHWYLQSKILHRHEVADMLPEAVDLLEFANRPETRDCPQSVCVTQDLACTYAEIDGPGYADERLAVATETLARIDATWPCFDCISGEYASALMDAGRYQDTLAFIEEQRRQLAERDIFELGGNLMRHRAVTLLELGRYDEAMEQLDLWDAESEGGYRALSKRIITARCMAKELARESAQELAPEQRPRPTAPTPEDILEALPTPAEVLPTPGLYDLYITALHELARAALVLNDWRLGHIMRRMNRRLEHNGARHASAWSALRAAELADDRNAPAVARRLLECARSGLSRLRRPDLLQPDIDALERSLDGADDDDESVLERLFLGDEARALEFVEAVERRDADALVALSSDDPERDLEMLELALVRAPELGHALPVVVRQCLVLHTIGFADEAEALLEQRIREHPDATRLLYLLAESLLDGGRARELVEFLDQFDERASADASLASRWLRAKALRALGEDERACTTLRALRADLGEDDERHESVALELATLERERGAYEAAFDILSGLAAREPEPGIVHWDFMIAATLLERWDTVRAIAARLGMDLPGTGPIDVAGGLCRVRTTDQSGRETSHVALRNGPVTARILEITAASDPSGRERHGDLVVISPAPLSEPEDQAATDGDDDEDDEDERPPLYQVIATLHEGGFKSFALDGVHPGDDAWSALTRALHELGGTVLVFSNESYTIEDPGGGDEPLPGLYARAAVPRDTPAREVHALLREHAETWVHPMVWLELARQLDDPDELERQRALMLEYQL